MMRAARRFLPAAILLLYACSTGPYSQAERPFARWSREQPTRQADPLPEDETETPGLNVQAGNDLQAFQAPARGRRVAERLPTVVRLQETGLGVAFNFQNAEIQSVAASVLGEALGLPYTIAPGVAGRISLQTSNAIPRESVLIAFESALQSVGVYLVAEGTGYKLVRASETGALGAPAVVGLSNRQLRAGYGLHIVPVDFVSATQLAEMLTPFVSPGGSVKADRTRNLLLISGTGRERISLLDMVAVFDVDWMAGLSYALYPLTYAKPEPVSQELAALFSNGGEAAAQLDGAVRILPVERLNALLIVAPNDVLVNRAIQWAGRLDQSGGAGGKRLYVYNVQNGRARDLAQVLGPIFGAAEQADNELNLSGIAPGLRATTQTGTPDGIVGNQGPQAGPAVSASTDTEQDLASSPARQRTDPEQISFANERLRVLADDRNNALVILATPQDYQLIRSSLEQLDVPPLQVLIEATIAEVTLTDALEFGVQWFFEEGDFDLSLGNLATGASVGAFGGFVGQFADDDTQIILSALDEVTDVEVVSSPQLLVLNNQTALLQVGDEVPIPVNSFVDVDNPGTISNQIEFRSTGVILRVTPRVNAGGMVQLDIEQEVSDVVPTASSGIDAPTIQQSRLASTVAVRSGATVALGGLIEDSYTETDSGFPLLKDIPYLGNLFKTTTRTQERSELLVLITPRVIANHEQAVRATEELRARMRTLAPAIE